MCSISRPRREKYFAAVAPDVTIFTARTCDTGNSTTRMSAQIQLPQTEGMQVTSVGFVNHKPTRVLLVILASTPKQSRHS
jgi:hypothetical protein